MAKYNKSKHKKSSLYCYDCEDAHEIDIVFDGHPWQTIIKVNIKHLQFIVMIAKMLTK